MSDTRLNINKEFWEKVKECWSNYNITETEEAQINKTVEDLLGKRKKRKRIKSALEFLTEDLEEI